MKCESGSNSKKKISNTPDHLIKNVYDHVLFYSVRVPTHEP